MPPPPLPLPVRVLVKGASPVNWVSWMGGPRTDFTFPRALEERLLAGGRPADVRAITMPSELARKILRSWQQEVLGYSPDVIVLVYGHYETIHLFLPRWLERHANSLKPRPRRLSNLYRTRVLRPLWMSLARLQARVDRVLPTIRRGRPRRVADDLEAYIGQVQKVGSPLVLVFEVLPPSQRWQSWFPGMAARVALLNDAVAAMVRRVDLPHVRYFRLSDLVDRDDDAALEAAAPDGIHFSPALHREIGAVLAEQIEEWAGTQPHLAPGSSAPVSRDGA